MKKIVVLVVLIGIFSLASVSYARIAEHVDSFDNTARIYSVQQNIGKMKGQFNFIKIIPKIGETSFQIYAGTEILKQYNFAKDYAEIKIDEKIYKTNIINNRDYKDTDNGIYDITTTVQLPPEAIEPLKIAEKVVLRFHRENGYKDIVELPDYVLEEWKQVINTEE